MHGTAQPTSPVTDAQADTPAGRMTTAHPAVKITQSPAFPFELLADYSTPALVPKGIISLQQVLRQWRSDAE